MVTIQENILFQKQKHGLLLIRKKYDTDAINIVNSR